MAALVRLAVRQPLRGAGPRLFPSALPPAGEAAAWPSRRAATTAGSTDSPEAASQEAALPTPARASWVAHTVGPADDGVRLDRHLREQGLANALVHRLIRKRLIRVNGKNPDLDTPLQAGDIVQLPPFVQSAPAGAGEAPRGRDAFEPDPTDVDMLRNAVLYRDADVLVLNKPRDLPTQGGSGVRRHVDGLLEGLRGKPIDERPRLVHRLDKDTTGCLVIALNRAAAIRLAAYFKSRKWVTKEYWAFVLGVPQHSEGLIDAALKRIRLGVGDDRMVLATKEDVEQYHADKSKRFKPDEVLGGDEDAGTLDVWPATTEYKLLYPLGNTAAWVRLWPLTGRRHQLRLHCAKVLRTPILGDTKYGGSHAADNWKPGNVRARQPLLGTRNPPMHLHLSRLALVDWFGPGKTLEVAAPLPEHMLTTGRALGMSAKEFKQLAREQQASVGPSSGANLRVIRPVLK